jgi:hypothetical protein
MSGAGGGEGGQARVLGRRSVLLVVAGGLLTALAILSLWSWRTFASSQGFADVATDMLKEPAVREVVADQILDAMENQAPTAQSAVSFRPALEQIVEQVVALPAFQGIFHAGARQLHESFVEGTRSRMLVQVDDSAPMLKESLNTFRPGLADNIPDQAFSVLVGVSRNTPADTLVTTASIAGWLALPLAIASWTCFFFAIRSANDRRRAIEAVGLCLVIVGVAFFALLAVGVSLFAQLGSDPRQRTALRAVFWSTSHLLNVQGKVAITIGAVLVVSASYVGKGRPEGRFRDLWNNVSASLTRPHGKVAVSLLGISCAVFAMAFPAATAAIAVRVGAFAAFVAGTVGLLDAIGEREWSLGSSPRVRQATTRLLAGSVASIAALSVVLLFGGVAFARAMRAPSADPPEISETGCNGHMELCDRPVDDVAFAATHNSMAASGAEGTWYFARHTDGISSQLARGVRAFLIDLHYGYRASGVVRTDFGSEAEARAAEDDLTAAEVEKLQSLGLGSIFARVGAARQSSDVYLCHGVCELGATPAEDQFRDVHDWLRVNPNEVLILIVEDHVDAADAIAALEDSGLADRAYPWAPGEPLPTLREMIETSRNILVLSERGGGEVPWYVPAHAGALMETPFDFAAADEFSCVADRGGEDSPLFLLNHWITTNRPDPNLAAEVNSSAVLGTRAEQCGDERDHLPNIVAVDFSTRGDLLDVVATLNGVGGAAISPGAEASIPQGAASG